MSAEIRKINVKIVQPEKVIQLSIVGI